MSTLSGSSLFAGITSGLSSTYSIIANANSGNVTLSNIVSTMGNANYAASVNPTFASYIESNFSSLDTNHDGTLSAAELSQVTNMMNLTGMTRTQLTQLGSASGLSSRQLGEVLDHFVDIDSNGDGKITAAEINAYNLTSAMEKKKTEFSNKAANNMSVFFGEDDSSQTNSSSLLNYKYINDSDNNTNGANPV